MAASRKPRLRQMCKFVEKYLWRWSSPNHSAKSQDKRTANAPQTHSKRTANAQRTQGKRKANAPRTTEVAQPTVCRNIARRGKLTPNPPHTRLYTWAHGPNSHWGRPTPNSDKIRPMASMLRRVLGRLAISEEFIRIPQYLFRIFRRIDSLN